jgi:CDP-glucose 4,6-dehydratase
MESLEEITGKVNSKFWKGKRIFLTGHTGFKGSWLSLWLQEMGSVVKGYSLAPNTSPNLFTEAKVIESMDSEIGDIRDLERVTKSMIDFNPDIVLHMAAQPLVRLSYIEPIETYSTNVMGTLNVLEAARKCKNIKAIIAITTDKCYENKELNRGYKEHDPMGGHDPYSSSKGCCELLISSYRRSFFNTSNTAALASARAGNVIGGGDWADNRLIPDILNAFAHSKKVIVRNPSAVRPWQHVLEPLSGYLVLAEKLYLNGKQYAEGWNFGPKDKDCKNVEYILDKIVAHWGEGSSWSLDDKSNPHEANFLKLDISKSARKLKWKPKWGLDFTLKSTVNWHKQWLSGEDIRKVCISEINHYNS